MKSLFVLGCCVLAFGALTRGPATAGDIPRAVVTAIWQVDQRAAVIDSKDIDAQLCGSDQLRKQILAADFNGDGIVDYAILLRLGKPQKGGLRWNPAIEADLVSIVLVVFLGRNDGTFRPLVLERDDHDVIPLDSFLAIKTPGQVRNGETHSIMTLKLPGIHRFYCGRSSRLFYWNPRANSFHQIWTGD